MNKTLISSISKGVGSEGGVGAGGRGAMRGRGRGGYAGRHNQKRFEVRDKLL